MESDKRVLVIIPAYNEQDSILKVYKTVLKNKGLDIVVINDGSNDNTERILTENRIPHVTLIENLGIGGAVQTGYKYAAAEGYDVAVQFDGDGQHRAEDLRKVIKPVLLDEADMVIGSRFCGVEKGGFKSTLMRRTGIKAISGAIKLKTKKKIYDTTSGFRAVNRRLIELFAADYDSEYPEPISTAAAILHGCRVKEVPVRMKAREGGRSSIVAHKSAYYMINVVLQIMTKEENVK